MEPPEREEQRFWREEEGEEGCWEEQRSGLVVGGVLMRDLLKQQPADIRISVKFEESKRF